MIRHISWILALLVCMGCGSKSKLKNWVTFTVTGEKFSVLMPKTAVEYPDEGSESDKLRTRVFGCDVQANEQYRVRLSEHKTVSQFTPEKLASLLSFAQDKLAASFHGTLEGTKDLSFAKGTAKEFLVRLKDGKDQFTKVHLFVCGNRVCQFFVTGSESFVNGKEATAFFDSIRFDD